MATLTRLFASNQLILHSDLAIELTSHNQNASYIRWTHASVNKHFENFNFGVPIYIEGDDRGELDDQEFVELRLDGPFITRVSRYLAYWDIEINLLVQTHMSQTDLYRNQALQGKIVSAFTQNICVYRFGDTELDDGARVGNYRLQRDYREAIDVNFFGLIRPDTRLQQATIEGHYRWEVSLI